MNSSQPNLAIPFPGLRPFDEADHLLFFGRNEQANELLMRLEDSAFVAVVGSSGSGKSSLVRAGLLPLLRDGFLFGTDNWKIAVARPVDKPYQRLALKLTAFSDDVTQTEVLRLLRSSDDGLIQAVDAVCDDSEAHVLVVIDQFEELFGFRRMGDSQRQLKNCASRDEAAAFVSMLLAAARKGGDRLRIMITMRSDFVGDCEVFLGLPQAVSQSQFLVPRLTRSQMEEAITGPSRIRGAGFEPFDFEPGLITTLTNDAGDRPDQLPLLQHALMRTWKLSDRKYLTVTSYTKAGRIKKALSNDADDAWSQLDDDDKQLARQMFLLLCDVSQEGQMTRRRPQAQEVMDVAQVDCADIERVVRVFQAEDRNFMLPPNPETILPTTLLDISHESLLRQWRRLKQWVEDEAISAESYRHLSGRALRWLNEGADLLGDNDLRQTIQWQKEQIPSELWAARYGNHYTLAMEFLAKSKLENKKKQRAKRLKYIYLAPTIILIFALYGLYEVLDKNDELASTNAELALTKKISDQKTEDLEKNTKVLEKNTKILEKADEIQDTMVLVKSAFESNRVGEGFLFTLTTNRAHRQLTALLTAKNENPTVGTVGYGRLIDAFFFEPRLLKIFHEPKGRVNAVAFSPSGKYFAMADQGDKDDNLSEGTVYIRNAKDPKFLFELNGHKDSVSSITFLSDKKHLISGGWGEEIFLWKLDYQNLKGESIQLYPNENEKKSGNVVSVLSNTNADGTAVLVAFVEETNEDKSKTIKILEWQFQEVNELSGRKPIILDEFSEFLVNDEMILSMTIMPDNKHLILGTNKGNVYQYNRENKTHTLLPKEKKYRDHVISVAVNKQGTQLVTADNKGKIFLYEAEKGIKFKNTIELKGHEDSVLDVEFSSDGQQLVSAGRNGELFLWNLKEKEGKPKDSTVPFSKLRGHTDWVRNVAFSPNGEYLISGDGDSHVNLWSVGDHRALTTTLRGHNKEIWSIAFVEDKLFSGGLNHELFLWNVKGQKRAEKKSSIEDESKETTKTVIDSKKVGDSLTSLVLGFDESDLLSAEENGIIRGWDITQNKLSQKWVQDIFEDSSDKDRLNGIAFSQELGLLATSTYNGKLKLWHWQSSKWEKVDGINKRLNQNAEVKVTGWGDNLAFSPDGTQLAFGVERTNKDSASEYYIKLLKFNDDKEEITLQSPPQRLSRDDNTKGSKGHSGKIYSLVFNEKYIVSGGDDNTIITWVPGETEDSKWKIDLRLEGHSNRINSIATHPKNENIIASGSRDRSVRLWDIKSGRLIGTMREHSDFVGKVVFSRDGKTLASASDDETIILWNVDFKAYPDLACEIVNRSLNDIERNKYDLATRKEWEQKNKSQTKSKKLDAC